MKSFFQLREDLNTVAEASKITNQKKKSAIRDLSRGGSNDPHTGHAGMSRHHASMADEHKGTEAGKHHQRASDHHERALAALKKGNLKSGLAHAKNAADAASAAFNSNKHSSSHGGMKDSQALHKHHEREVGFNVANKSRDAENLKRDKPKRSDKPVQRAIGKTKSKIKKMFSKEAIQEDKYGSGTEDNYKYNVHGYTGEKGDDGHHAMLAKAKARNVKVTTGRSNPNTGSSTDGKHIILRGKKKDVDHVIDNHIGRISESWETIGRTSDGNYKIQRDPETGARRKVPAQMRNEETPTGKQVKQAIGIARDKRYAKGNMTGAVKTMNKINPKLSNHPRVKDELQKQNEDKAADRDALQKAMDVFKKRGGKITKVAPGKAAGYHGKDDPGQDVKGMMDRGDTKTMPRKKKVGSMK